MLHIDVFTLATFIKISDSGHVPIHFLSTKQNTYGAIVLGDVFIPNRLINLSSGETLLLKLNYTVTSNNNNYSHTRTVEMSYDENTNTWFFIGKNLKYEIYTLITPFAVSIDLALILPNTTFSTLTEVNLTSFDSVALLPSGIHINFTTSETTTSAKLITDDPDLNVQLTLIDSESQHIINLNTLAPTTISSNDDIRINEIVLKNKTTIVEQIILNTFFTNVPGYIKGTLIKTVSGFSPIENVKPGSKLLTHRNRPIEVIQVYHWISLSYLMYAKNNLLIHKDILLLSSKGQLQTPQEQNLILAPAKPGLKSYYAIELGGPNKIVLTDNNIVENIGKGLTQHYLTIYKRKLLKIDV